jgi:hypothetical protein
MLVLAMGQLQQARSQFSGQFNEFLVARAEIPQHGLFGRQTGGQGSRCQQ